MIPSIIQQWIDTKTAIFQERDRCLELYAQTRAAIKESCGQDIDSLEILIGCIPYRLAVSYGKPVFTNFPTKIEHHWDSPLGHYRKVLAELQRLTPTEMEYRLLKKMEKAATEEGS